MTMKMMSCRESGDDSFAASVNSRRVSLGESNAAVVCGLLQLVVAAE